MKTTLFCLLALLVAASLSAELRVFVGEFPGRWSFINLTLPSGSVYTTVPLSATTQPNVLDCAVAFAGQEGCLAEQCYRFDLTYALPNGIGSRVRMTRSRGNELGVPLFITQEKGIEWRPPTA